MKVAAHWASDSASDWAAHWAAHSTVSNRPKVEYLKPFFLVIFSVFFCYKSAVTRAIQRTYPFLGKNWENKLITGRNLTFKTPPFCCSILYLLDLINFQSLGESASVVTLKFGYSVDMSVCFQRLIAITWHRQNKP